MSILENPEHTFLLKDIELAELRLTVLNQNVQLIQIEFNAQKNLLDELRTKKAAHDAAVAEKEAKKAEVETSKEVKSTDAV